MADGAPRHPTPFGFLLLRHRAEAGLTREQLAARARLSRDGIAALERGTRRTPRAATIHLLADALTLNEEERAALLEAARRPRPTSNADVHAEPPAPAWPGRPPTRLVGRSSELETIRRRLCAVGADGARLLTLTGPAGVGKTRLALAAADEIGGHFPDGVTLIDLAPVRHPPLVLWTIARALGLADAGNGPLLVRLQDVLREREQLLVLDNFEQVLPAATILSDLLASCPGLRLLLTSRVPLQLRWEQALRVSPLPVPARGETLSLDTLLQIPAVALFMERARSRRAGFTLTAARAPLVAELVAQLDGLPLAIELAASRLDTLPLATIARRVADRLQLLRWQAPDLPERQRSLEAAIGWSYDLLDANEQRLFRCLGVFAGRVSLDAIAAVAAGVGGGDGSDDGRTLQRLASLAEKSLLLPAWQDGHDEEDERDEEDEPAFGMLETVREYAWEQLRLQGELEAARRAHAAFFLSLAERADPRLRGSEQRVWFNRLEGEHDNLRTALRWWLDQGGPDAAAEREAALRLATGLGWFWWTRGYIVAGARWLEKALGRAPEADPSARTRALLGEGSLLAYQGEFIRAKVVLEEALALALRRRDPPAIARAFTYLGLRAIYSGDVAASVPLLHEALRRGRALDDPHLVGLTLMFLGTAVFAQGHDEQAAALYAESLTSFEAAGDALFAGNLHVNLGWFAGRRGDLPMAVGHIRTGLEAGVTFQDRRLLSVGAQMALSLLDTPRDRADLTRRARLLGAVDALSQATGMTLLQTLLKSSLAGLRERIARDGLEAAYREGRSLPFGAVAALALAVLEEVGGTLAHPELAPWAALRSGRSPRTLPGDNAS